MNKTNLKNVLFTIAYYNALDYYPTSFFVWKHLIDIGRQGQKVSLITIIQIIDFLKNKNKIQSKNGFLAIKNIKLKYKQQIQRDKLSIQKIKKIQKWVKFISLLPYNEELFLTGTLAMKRSDGNSDWDILSIIKRDRIWLGRLILTVFIHLLGKRRYGAKIKNRFCLNQFMVDNRLNFQERNEYAGNEILMARALINNKNNYQNRLIKSNFNWLKKIKPNFHLKNIYDDITQTFWQKEIKKFLEKFLEFFLPIDFCNKMIKKLMIKKIVNNPKTYINEADVRYGDFFLIFLPRPQRNLIKEKTYQLLTNLD